MGDRGDRGRGGCCWEWLLLLLLHRLLLLLYPHRPPPSCTDTASASWDATAASWDASNNACSSPRLGASTTTTTSATSVASLKMPLAACGGPGCLACPTRIALMGHPLHPSNTWVSGALAAGQAGDALSSVNKIFSHASGGSATMALGCGPHFRGHPLPRWAPLPRTPTPPLPPLSARVMLMPTFSHAPLWVTLTTELEIPCHTTRHTATEVYAERRAPPATPPPPWRILRRPAGLGRTPTRRPC